MKLRVETHTPQQPYHMLYNSQSRRSAPMADRMYVERWQLVLVVKQTRPQGYYNCQPFDIEVLCILYLICFASFQFSQKYLPIKFQQSESLAKKRRNRKYVRQTHRQVT